MSALEATKQANGHDESAADPTERGQALFFTAPYPLTPERHSNAGLRKEVDYGFARQYNSVPITLEEMAEVARSYPIVFSKEDVPVPLAVMGLARTNLFIDEQGQWDPAHYIPSYVRKYPFGLTQVPDSDQFILCVDEEAPHFMNENPDLPFYAGEQLTELCQKALNLAGGFQQQALYCQQFGRALKAAGLLEEKQMQLTHSSGEKRAMGGFQIINEDKWNEFAATNISEWHQKGYAARVTLALASQVNWKYLALRS